MHDILTFFFLAVFGSALVIAAIERLRINACIAIPFGIIIIILIEALWLHPL